jgi:GNAT superfamily N-acetyltransferase
MTVFGAIRTAVPDDIPALTTLIARSARQLSRGYYTERESESAITYVFGVDSTLIADGTYYVVEVDGALAACGGWSRRRTLYGGDQRPVGAPGELLDPMKDPARIRAFFVAPEFARRGFGRVLLAHCVSAAAQAGFRSLELMSTLPGVPFYGALGFDSIEPVRDVLPDGVPLSFVRMTRPINAPASAANPMSDATGTHS